MTYEEALLAYTEASVHYRALSAAKPPNYEAITEAYHAMRRRQYDVDRFTWADV